ncbi:MAG: fumarylacetoacetate hydrolase family protein [Acidimicrobiales bacterium]
MRVAVVRLGTDERVARIDGGSPKMLPFRTVPEALASAGSISGLESIEGADVPMHLALDFAPLLPMSARVFCIGHNYRGHIEEMGREIPDRPTVFSKFGTSLLGSNDDLCLSSASTMWDWEIELAVVLGAGAPAIEQPRDAGRAIAGFAVSNDVTARDLQRQSSQWFLAKSFDAVTPLGPFLVTTDEVGDGSGLELTCTVDGEVMQRGSTSDLVFSPAELVFYLSRHTRLIPGDVILTGTPSGVGAGRSPEVYLDAGQTLHSEITGLGSCSNRCVEAS